MSLQPVLYGGNGCATDLDLFFSESENNYQLYLGPALIERISCSPEHLEYKVMVGRLFNAGWKMVKLRKFFPHKPDTIKRWGKALKSDDADFVTRVFSGRGGQTKVTDAIERFASARYKELKGQLFDYSLRIIEEIQSIFRVKLSAETLRQIFRRTDRENEIHQEAENSASSEVQSVSRTAENCPITCVSEENSSSSFSNSPKQWGNFTPPGSLPARADHRGIRQRMIHHAGLVLFAQQFDLFCGQRENCTQQLQWIGQLLQGAVNVEQSRNVSMKDISLLSGGYLACLNGQRAEIHASAADRNKLYEIYQANTRLLNDGPGKGDKFYVDPTTKTYTGKFKLLKGWCGSTHGVDKVVYLDSIHTVSGRPCFINHYAPFYDLRVRFFMMLHEFNQLFPVEKRRERTFIIDRGIFGEAAFQRFDDSGDYLLTWEKNYKGDGWDEEAETVSFERTKIGNSKEVKRLYRFECQQFLWKKRRNWRRIIVRATNPSGNEIQLSILCSNPDLPIEEAVWLMFCRWLQENNFKYMNSHFGLGQITCYKTKEFANHADEFEDQQVDSIEYRELKKEQREAQTKCSQALFKSQREKKKLEGLEQKMKELKRQQAKLKKQAERMIKAYEKTGRLSLEKSEEVLSELIKKRQENEKLRQKQERFSAKIEVLEKSVAVHTQQYEEIDNKIVEAVRKESRLELLISNNYRFKDTAAKAFFDALRVCAHNMFMNLIDIFRPILNNYRNDHAMLRQITRSDGAVRVSDTHTTVKLWLKGSFQDHQTKAFQKFLTAQAQSINKHFAGNIKPVEISLAESI